MTALLNMTVSSLTRAGNGPHDHNDTNRACRDVPRGTLHCCGRSGSELTSWRYQGTIMDQCKIRNARLASPDQGVNAP